MNIPLCVGDVRHQNCLSLSTIVHKILENYGKFWKTVENSGKLWTILENYGKFCQIMKNSGKLMVKSPFLHPAALLRGGRSVALPRRRSWGPTADDRSHATHRCGGHVQVPWSAWKQKFLGPTWWIIPGIVSKLFHPSG